MRATNGYFYDSNGRVAGYQPIRVDDETITRSDHDPAHRITEAERAAIASTICPDCGDSKTADRPLCGVCQRFQGRPQLKDYPRWFTVGMLILMATVGAFVVFGVGHAVIALAQWVAR